MNFLFVHNNFPAQFRNVVGELVERGDCEVAAIGCETATQMDGVLLRRYRTPPGAAPECHPFARRFDFECRRAEQVLYAASEFAADGFVPDVIVVHCGWGENLTLRARFPGARIVVYCEYYYRADGQDVHFEGDGPRLGVDGVAGLHCKNASTLLALVDADLGMAPTRWQRSTYPPEFQSKIEVVHEGIDTTRLAPNANAAVILPSGKRVHRDREVVTFIARNLEPIRGYHVFMRAVADIQNARPNADIVVVGGDLVSYGPPPLDGGSWKTLLLDELQGDIDFSRFHLLEPLPYDDYLKLLQVSSAHVYLTYPFVLSWSFVEAMSVGCTLIASDTAPVREAIEDGVSGVLVPFDQPKRLAEATTWALANRDAAAALGAAARRAARAQYDKKDCVRRTLELIAPGLPTAPRRVEAAA